MNKSRKEVSEFCAKCLVSRYPKRAYNRLYVEQLFYETSSEEMKSIQYTLAELQKRIDAKE